MIAVMTAFLLSLNCFAKNLPPELKMFIDKMTHGQTELFNSDEGRPLEIHLISNYSVIEASATQVRAQYNVVGLLLWDDVAQRYSYMRYPKAKAEQVSYSLRQLKSGAVEILAPFHPYPFVKQELLSLYLKGKP